MSDISEKVLAITIQVLGPASRRFLERQTKFHLDGLEFDDLKKSISLSWLNGLGYQPSSLWMKKRPLNSQRK